MDRIGWVFQVLDFGLDEIININQTPQYFEAKSKTLIQEGTTIDLRVESKHELKYKLVVFVVYKLHYLLFFMHLILLLW